MSNSDKVLSIEGIQWPFPFHSVSSLRELVSKNLVLFGEWNMKSVINIEPKANTIVLEAGKQPALYGWQVYIMISNNTLMFPY